MLQLIAKETPGLSTLWTVEVVFLYHVCDVPMWSWFLRVVLVKLRNVLFRLKMANGRE